MFSAQRLIDEFAKRGVVRRVAIAPAFRIARGQHTAIVGASGAGKTTLSRLLLGVWSPDGGTLLLEGQPYASLPAVGASLAMLVVSNFVLVPSFGLTGAALAALLGMATWSGVLWFTALKVAGVDVSLRARLARPAAPVPKVAD